SRTRPAASARRRRAAIDGAASARRSRAPGLRRLVLVGDFFELFDQRGEAALLGIEEAPFVLRRVPLRAPLLLLAARGVLLRRFGFRLDGGGFDQRSSRRFHRRRYRRG